MPPSANLPAFSERVLHFTAALGAHLRDGLRQCSTDEIQARLEICQACDRFDGQHCLECGCNCSGNSSFFNKLAWRSEACPLGKWSACPAAGECSPIGPSGRALFDVFTVYHPRDDCANGIGRDKFAEIYQTKYELARMLTPRTVFEFGVRAGYSAAAFLAASPAAQYVGIDNNGTAHGGVPGFPDHARQMLASRYPRARVRVDILDSRAAAAQARLLQDFRHHFDLAHVDGDQSLTGCRSDLELALQLVHPGGYVVVDDYTLLPEVRRAVRDFLASPVGQTCSALPIASPHGEVLIRKAI